MHETLKESTFALPSGYDDNRIILLPRDPYWLYAYWEISNSKKKSFFKEFGYQLWEKSVPALKITNTSKQTTFYIDIEDFSTSRYVNVNESNCMYTAEIGRRLPGEFFISLASSNSTATPGDRASENVYAYFINYKDMKAGKPSSGVRNLTRKYKQAVNTIDTFGISSGEIFGISSGELRVES